MDKREMWRAVWRGPAHGNGRTVRLLASVGLLAVLVTTLLSACDPSAHDLATGNKAKLDHEIQIARTTYYAPDSLLQPIETQESKLAANTKSGSDASYQSAAAGYTRLYNAVVAIEKMTPAQARAQTSGDLQQLSDAITSVQKQGFTEIAQYTPRLQQAQQQFAAATTTKEYFQVDRFVQTQLAAVNDINPVYQQMQALNTLVNQRDAALGLASTAPQPLQCAIGDVNSYFAPDPAVNVTPAAQPTYEFQQWPAQDLALFRAASSTQDYDALVSLMQAQTTQLAADASEETPIQAATLLQTFQANVQAYQQDGGKDTQYQQQAAQDAQALAAAKTFGDYTAFVKTVQQQTQAMALPLTKVQAQADLEALKKLVAEGQTKKIYDPYDGVSYADDYEYALQQPNAECSDCQVGIGDAQARLQNAQTLADYQVVDQEIQMLSTNLQAMLQDIGDKTPANQVHQEDISLLQHYGITSGKVVVVSLWEQAARMYDNGKLVASILVTTGNPDLPTPPGVHCAWGKMTNYLDKSPYPKGSPFYYNPTPIHYGLLYSDYGFFMHDAWWRTDFGGHNNLPHYDPIAFNSGSHGCINVPYSAYAQQWAFDWLDYGTPIVVY
ncbi:MAG TPA: L,D-transpeptidase [Ktedonobacterales bacterium]|nr:L,D-transpeptidase [Ktedonobacterales bacterium]